jgi:hypothetical protein
MEWFHKMFHAKEKKPRIALNSPLTKTSKMTKNIKEKDNPLM